MKFEDYFRLVIADYDGEKMRKALITGINGQDSSYLAELLLIKDMKYMES